MSKVEPYWSRVADAIAARGDGNVIAGDDNPYFRYKRRVLLQRFLHTLPAAGRSVLEVGCGPGGNLVELSRRQPAHLFGVDISPAMVDLAQRAVASANVPAIVQHIDGTHLRFADNSIDLTFTVTVLQHNTDGAGLEALIEEMTRVTRSTIVLMEDIGPGGVHVPGESYVGRRVDVYQTLLARHGFTLRSCEFQNTRVSRAVMGWTRRFWPAGHHEGDAVGAFATTIMRATLPLTRLADRLLQEKAGLAKMTFVRA